MIMAKDYKAAILQHVSDLDIFYHYLGTELKFGKTIISPLRDEKNPSFNIYQSSNGKIYFKDFSGERGDCFLFVMRLFDCSFSEALKIIASDFNIQSDSAAHHTGRRSEQIRNVIKIPSIMKRERTRIDVVKKDWDKKSQPFWRQWGITQFILNEYNVYPVESYTMNKKDGGEFTIKWKDDDPIYCFDYGTGAKKIYRPHHKNKRWKFVSNLIPGDLFGINQLDINYKQNLLIICAGQKDCLSLYANTGIRGIALNSESASITNNQYLELLNYTKNIAVCYDTDPTGIQNANKLNSSIGIDVIDLNQLDFEGKDISDVCHNLFGLNIDSLKKLIIKTCLYKQL